MVMFCITCTVFTVLLFNKLTSPVLILTEGCNDTLITLINDLIVSIQNENLDPHR